jgi:hypothetical protein
MHRFLYVRVKVDRVDDVNVPWVAPGDFQQCSADIFQRVAKVLAPVGGNQDDALSPGQPGQGARFRILGLTGHTQQSVDGWGAGFAHHKSVPSPPRIDARFLASGNSGEVTATQVKSENAHTLQFMVELNVYSSRQDSNATQFALSRKDRSMTRGHYTHAAFNWQIYAFIDLRAYSGSSAPVLDDRNWVQRCIWERHPSYYCTISPLSIDLALRPANQKQKLGGRQAIANLNQLPWRPPA